jgi:hypothetical protein
LKLDAEYAYAGIHHLHKKNGNSIMNRVSSRRWQIFSASAVIRHFDCLGIFEKVDIKLKNG